MALYLVLWDEVIEGMEWSLKTCLQYLLFKIRM